MSLNLSKELNKYVYYKEENPDLVILHGDCLEILPLLPKVDLVVTDLPYGRKTHEGARTGSVDEILVTFDSQTAEQTEEQFKRFVDIARRWVIATIEWQHMANLHKYDWFIRHGVWIKPNGMPQYTGDRPATGWEAVAICHRPGRKVWNGGGSHAVWNIPKVHGNHPTEKPLDLIKTWLMDFSNDGETILDPFMGSGTTLVACKELNRNGIGIEINEKYCEMAKKRLKATCKPLFTDVSGAKKSSAKENKQNDTQLFVE